jgi:hypothetical protein
MYSINELKSQWGLTLEASHVKNPSIKLGFKRIRDENTL